MALATGSWQLSEFSVGFASALAAAGETARPFWGSRGDWGYPAVGDAGEQSKRVTALEQRGNLYFPHKDKPKMLGSGDFSFQHLRI